jgi:hypothetical protein
VYKDALSYLCLYSRGWKDEDSIPAAWRYVKREKCGFDSLGYAQAEGGEGEWLRDTLSTGTSHTAGATFLEGEPRGVCSNVAW